MATRVADMGFRQAHRNRSTLDDVPEPVRVLVLKGLRSHSLRGIFTAAASLLRGLRPILGAVGVFGRRDVVENDRPAEIFLVLYIKT